MTELDWVVKRKKFLLKWGLIGFGLITAYLLSFQLLIDKRPFVEWTLIKSGPEQTQPEAQLVKMPDGQVFLINAGEAKGTLLFYLKKQKIKDIDLLLLTSYEPWALSGLKEMLFKGIRIKEILVNPLSPEKPSWIEIKQRFLSKGGIVSSLDSHRTLFSKLQTDLKVVALDKDALVIRLVHGKNSLALGLGSPLGLGPQLRQLNCSHLKTEVVLNYTETEKQEPYLDWLGCLKPIYDLSSEKGTFKVLLKGDSFKLKRG